MPSSGSPTNMPSTLAARAIDSAGVVEACGPKQNIGAPKRVFSVAIAATSASSVGVVLGKTISVGVKPSRVELARSCPRSSSRSAVRSISRTSQPRVAQQRRQQRQRVGRLGRAEDVFALLAAALPRERDAVDRAAG